MIIQRRMFLQIRLCIQHKEVGTQVALTTTTFQFHVYTKRTYISSSIDLSTLFNKQFIIFHFFVIDTHTQQNNRKFCLHCDMCQLESYSLVQCINYVVSIEIKLTKV